MADDVEPTQMPQLVTRPNVDLVAAGTWQLSTGEATFTAEDLQAAVEAQSCPAIGQPVIKLGHVDPRFDGEPAVGFVANMGLAANGQKITGDLTGIPAWLDAVLASAYPNRSIEGYQNFTCSVGHVHPFVLTGLALLGVTPPGVGVLSSLKDVAALYGVAAAVDRTYGQGDRWNLSLPNQPEILEGATMPEPVMAAGVTVEDVRRAYYEADSTPMTSWITAMQLDPPQLIVSDDTSGDLYRVPVAIGADGVSFGDPVKVQVEYQDVAEKQSASRFAASWTTAAESRSGLPDAAATSEPNMIPSTAAAADQEVAAMQITVDDAQLAELRVKLGKGEDEELTGAEILAALTAPQATPAEPQADPQPEPQVSAAAQAEQGTVRVDAAQWAQVQQDVQAGREARDEQRRQHRDTVIGAAIKAGKFPPGRRGHFEELWALDPAGTEEHIGKLAAGLVPLADIGVAGGEAPADDGIEPWARGLFPEWTASN